MSKQRKTVLALDIGGTKVALAAVSSEGDILKRKQIETDLSKGASKFISTIAEVATAIISEFDCTVAGVASAGPLDPINGNLIHPTNMHTGDTDLECFPLVDKLQAALNLKVVLENDAAAAILGEAWVGKAANCESAMIVTLGTGVGVGVISRDKLMRLRQSFHPEASHISINFLDKEAVCGCGNIGCIEAYLGGKNFVAYANKKWSLNVKDGHALIEKAKSGEPEALKAFDFYSQAMAQALNAYAVLFAPEVIVFSGGFSHAFPFFRVKTLERLQDLLHDRRVGLDFMPRLALSERQEDMGLIGAARIALEYPKRL